MNGKSSKHFDWWKHFTVHISIKLISTTYQFQYWKSSYYSLHACGTFFQLFICMKMSMLWIDLWNKRREKNRAYGLFHIRTEYLFCLRFNHVSSSSFFSLQIDLKSIRGLFIHSSFNFPIGWINLFLRTEF